MRRCEICGKGALTGNTIARRGMAKKKGGVGKKITGITRRKFYANLQKVKVRFYNGTVKRVKVCTGCLSAGKVTKAVAV